MGICKSRGLNPFIKDAYLIKYTANDNAAIIVSIDYYRKRARAQADCRGWKCGIVVKNLRDEIEYREGAIILDGETLIGGWFEAMPDGWDVPMKKTVNLNRYIKKTKDGRTTRFWSPENQPEMIVKVVEGQGLRSTWPDEFGGLYVDAEMQSQDAQAELDQAVRVKSNEPEPAAEQKPIGDILGKPETRAAAPEEKTEITAAEKEHAERNKLQAKMDAKMQSKLSPEMETAVKFTEKFGSIIKSPFFGEFWKQHCEKQNLPQQDAKKSALFAPDNFFSNFNAYLKSTQETPQKAQVATKSEKPTDDTPSGKKPQGGEPGPEIRPSLKQIFAKFPARLKITEGYKTLVALAADYPDQLIEILLENPVESLPDLGAALKENVGDVDQIETGGSEAEGGTEKKATYAPPLFNDEPPIPDGPPEW